MYVRRILRQHGWSKAVISRGTSTGRPSSCAPSSPQATSCLARHKPNPSAGPWSMPWGSVAHGASIIRNGFVDELSAVGSMALL